MFCTDTKLETEQSYKADLMERVNTQEVNLERKRAIMKNIEALVKQQEAIRNVVEGMTLQRDKKDQLCQNVDVRVCAPIMHFIGFLIIVIFPLY